LSIGFDIYEMPSKNLIMLRYLLIVLLVFTISSCSKRPELLIKNNSDKNIYIFYSELDSTINNLWIYKYSQKYYHTQTDSFINIRGIIEPKKSISIIYPDDRFINYKLHVYFIKYDSLLLLKKKDFDSTLVSRFLLKKCVVTGEDIFKQKTLEVCYP
jgi:hypothetical protein